MKLFFYILGLKIPAYGLMIACGVLFANIIAIFLLKKNRHSIEDFIIFQCYGALGGFIGGKSLNILIIYKYIAWDKIFEIEYFNYIMRAGFVFYGAMIGGVIAILIAGKIHHFDSLDFLEEYVMLLPLVHSFGRIGCFFAGCCYGIPYSGIFCVTFPKNSFAPSGISLFPIQLLESALLFLIFLSIIYLKLRYKFKYAIEFYLISYGIIRFFLEMYRFDSQRGELWLFTTSQWISVFMVIFGIAMCILKLNSKITYKEY